MARCDPPPYSTGRKDNGDHASYISALLASIADCDAKWQRLEVWLQQQAAPPTVRDVPDA